MESRGLAQVTHTLNTNVWKQAGDCTVFGLLSYQNDIYIHSVVLTRSLQCTFELHGWILNLTEKQDSKILKFKKKKNCNWLENRNSLDDQTTKKARRSQFLLAQYISLRVCHPIQANSWNRMHWCSYGKGKKGASSKCCKSEGKETKRRLAS